MTTTEPASTAAPPDAKKEPSLMDAMKRARELATAMVLLLTFFHSMYASYFKKEEVAEAGYEATSTAMEDYSRVVHDEIEGMKERIQGLESDLAKAKEAAKAAEGQATPTKVRPKNRRPVLINDVLIEGHPVGFPVAMVANPPDNPASLPELIQVDTDGISDAPAPDDSLIIDMPDRPWEQQKK